MAQKILVSFKQSEKELYELIKSQGDQSNFIKDALKFYIQYKNKPAPIDKNPDISKSEIMGIISGEEMF